MFSNECSHYDVLSCMLLVFDVNKKVVLNHTMRSTCFNVILFVSIRSRARCK